MRIVSSFLLLFITLSSFGQFRQVYSLTVEEAVSLALENHPQMMNRSLQDAHDRYALRNSWDIDPLAITYRTGELYGPERDRYLEINQDFGSLLQHISDYRLAGQRLKLERTEAEILTRRIIAEVKSAYYFWVFQQSRLNLLEQQQSLYDDVARIADLKYKKGEIDLAGRTGMTAEAAHAETKLGMARDDLEMASNKITQLTALEEEIVPALTELALYESRMPEDSLRYSDQIMAGYYSDLSKLNALSEKSRSALFFPQLSVGLIRQDIGGDTGLWAWQVGLAFPVWPPPRFSGVKLARIEADIAEQEYAYELQKINTTLDNLVISLNKCFREILYYDSHALVQADLLSEKTRLQLENEEIEYVEYVRQMKAATDVRLEYLDVMNRYNQTAIQLEFYAP